jgi:uncharacterized protein involved in exopolysaccharide biosynthesis
MFIYGPRAVDVKSGGHGSLGRAALDIKSIVVANKWLLAALAIAGALVGFAAAKLLPHKYVATTEIYIHPGSLSGGDKDVLAPGEDSNGFISYVESQVLIIKSRDVLERVVAEEKLDTDPDFAQASWLSEGSASLSTDADRANAAVAVLDTRITIRRPERTFVIELSVTDKDPVKAARLANATARGYIETVSALQLDASRQTETLLAGPLETYRARVLEAEKKVEDYKAAKGLVGTRDAYVTEQQLKDTNAQITAARTKAAEARATLAQIETARNGTGEGVAAIASQTLSPSLTALRTQQGLAHQHLADLLGQLGPLHPQVADARSQARATDAAVDAELARFARSQKIEVNRDRELEENLGRQLEALQRQAIERGELLVELRDLERDAESARKLYDAFVTRSQQVGEIQQVEQSRTRIISPAVVPKFRVSPPSAAVLSAVGLLGGLILGVAGLVARQRATGPGGAGSPRGAGDSKSSEKQRGKEHFFVTSRSKLEARRTRQSLTRIALRGLGFPVLPPEADTGEFDLILDYFDIGPRNRGKIGNKVVMFAVRGPGIDGLRSALAINLSLCAVRRGARVALVDAAESCELTQAVREVTSRAAADAKTPDGALECDSLLTTQEGVWLLLPKAIDPVLGQLSPAKLAASAALMAGIDLVLCDGPDLHELDGREIARLSDIVIEMDESGAGRVVASQSDPLAESRGAPDAYVHFIASSKADAVSYQAKSYKSSDALV